MTREEAIKWLEETIQDTDTYWESCSEALQKEIDEQKEVFLLALAALRGPTREMVERMRGEWEWLGPCRDNKGVSWGTCSVCKTRQRLGDHLSFCPACGAPMTDEAVDMMLRRWKEAVARSTS